MEAPQFIELNPAQTVADLVAEYKSLTGKVLQASQPEQLLINAFAYMLELQKSQIQAAGENCLVDFAQGAALERLGAFYNVVRLAAAKATVTVRFVLVPGHGGVTIPASTRVQTADGQQVFETVADIDVSIGVNEIDAQLQAQVAGDGANGFAIGTISIILDPQAFLASASNLTVSAGGADIETDIQLRERIKLAPSSFSTAGSVGAYAFHTKTASQTIIDVSVLNPAPGTVAVYPLVEGGIATPTETINLVESVLTDERVRPLTDTVVVSSPSISNYNIEVSVILFEGTQSQIALQAIEDALTAYAEEKQSRLGQDVTINQIIAEAGSVDGVYDVSVISPASDIILDFTQVAVIGNLTVNLAGFNEG